MKRTFTEVAGKQVVPEQYFPVRNAFRDPSMIDRNFFARMSLKGITLLAIISFAVVSAKGLGLLTLSDSVVLAVCAPPITAASTCLSVFVIRPIFDRVAPEVRDSSSDEE